MKANKAFFMIVNLLKTRNAINNKIKVVCYKQLIRPILTYAFPIWFNLFSHGMEAIRKFERKILHLCTNLKTFKLPDDTWHRPRCYSLYEACSTAHIAQKAKMADGDSSDTTVNSEMSISDINNVKRKNKRKKPQSSDECSEAKKKNDESRKFAHYEKTIANYMQIIDDLKKEINALSSLIKTMESKNMEPHFSGFEGGADNFPPLPSEPCVKSVTKADKSSELVSKENQCPPAEQPAYRKKISEKQSKGMPPIIVYNIEAKYIINKLKAVLGNSNFNVSSLNKNAMKLMVSHINDHQKTIEFLKAEGIKFFSYTPRELKPITFVISNLPLCFDEQEVCEAVNTLQIKVNSVKVIKAKYSWVLQVGRDSDIMQLKNIKFLLQCGVKIVDIKQKRVLQCKNCQRFNHTASNCNMAYRCVKCGESHGPGNCKIPPKNLNNEIIVVNNASTGAISKRVGLPVKCINCGNEGHTANAPICPKRAELTKKKLNNKHNASVNKAKYQKKTSDVSYASLLRNSNSSLSPNNNASGNPNNFNSNTSEKILLNSFDKINNDCNSFFGKDFYTCLVKVDDFQKKYSALKSDEEKTKALFNLFLVLKLHE